ncbi:MAG: protein kinase [Planctomycetota bacterium]
MARPKQLGPYRINNPLGKGGMGHVYTATHAETGERVAVKALSPELAMAEGFRERFQAEIDSLKLLRHDNIVQLFGYGEQDGVLFYAMELVDGSSLEEELRAGRRFNWREVSQIAVQVCRALKHAHDHGVIHRDIKPGNILVDRSEKVKLADFGIARLFTGAQLTLAGGVVGTADYMSPEQAASQPINDRCDQYSLGCVMYALLAGRPPFRATGLPQMLQLQRYAKPEPVSRFAPQTPKQLESVLTQLLDKSPDERFPNAMVLARHLEAMLFALTKPGRDDFQVGEPQPTPDPQGYDGEHGTPIEMAITQVDPSAPQGSSVSLAPLASGGDSSAVGTPEDPESVAEQAEAAARYTAVSTDLPLETRSSDRFSALGLASVLFLATAALIGAGYAAFRPATADELFAKIQAVPDRDWEAGDENAVATLKQFMRRFPDDPRQPNLYAKRRQLELAKLQTRLKLAAGRGPDRPSDLTAAERLYLQAFRMGQANPAAGADQLLRLATLLEVGGPDTREAQADATLAALAKQQAERLQIQAAQEAKDGVALIRTKLRETQKLARTQPAKARALCDALIVSYDDRPWAAAMLQDVRQLRQSLPPANATEAPPQEP